MNRWNINCCKSRSWVWRMLHLQADLTLQEGSGYFFVNGSAADLADVQYQDAPGTAEVGLCPLFLRAIVGHLV